MKELINGLVIMLCQCITNLDSINSAATKLSQNCHRALIGYICISF